MSSIAPRHVRAALAVAAAGCLALTGCSGTPGANGSPTSAGSSSASQSGSPSQSASASTPATPEPATSTSPAKNIAKPKMPREAKEFSKDGYEAFVDYWFEAQNYGMATGDTAPLEAASMDRCGICAERAKNIKRANIDGAWIVGGDIQLFQLY
jgi:hypothetical protein